MTLFPSGDFTLHAGDRSTFKIECDALTDEDVRTIARLIANSVGPFGFVVGVPTGGERFAKELSEYVSGDGPILVVDDVWTTGTSLNNVAGKLSAKFVKKAVVFARRPVPEDVFALFSLNERSA